MSIRNMFNNIGKRITSKEANKDMSILAKRKLSFDYDISDFTRTPLASPNLCKNAGVNNKNSY